MVICFLLAVLWAQTSCAGCVCLKEQEDLPDRVRNVHNTSFVHMFLRFDEQIYLWKFMTSEECLFPDIFLLKALLDAQVQRIFEDSRLESMQEYRQCYIFTDNIEKDGQTYEALCVMYARQSAGFYFILPQGSEGLPTDVVRIFDRFRTSTSDFGKGILLAIASYGDLYTQTISVENKQIPLCDMQDIRDLFR